MFCGLCLTWTSYKLGCYILDPNPLNLREKLEAVSSLQIVFHCARDGVYGKSVSQPVLPILMWVLWVFWLVSGLLSERVGLCVAVNSVFRRK